MSPLNLFSKRMKIGFRLATTLVVPILALVATAVLLTMKERVDQQHMHALNAIANFTVTVGGLVHELQKERSMSALFINSNGHEAANVAQ